MKDPRSRLEFWIAALSIVATVLGGTWHIAGELSAHISQMRLLEVHVCRIENKERLESFEECERELDPASGLGQYPALATLAKLNPGE